MIHVPHLCQKPGSQSCLVISVKMVLDYHGIYRTEAEIGAVMEFDPVLGASIMNIDLLPEKWGIMTYAGEIHPEDLKREINHDKPVLVVVEAPYLPYRDASIRANHTLVVVGYDDEVVYVNDALLAEAPTAIPWKDFLKAWDGLGKFGGIILNSKHNVASNV